MEPRKIKFSKPFGHLTLDFEAEDFGDGPLDTKVTISGEVLCWISYPELEEFMLKISAGVEEHRI